MISADLESGNFRLIRITLPQGNIIMWWRPEAGGLDRPADILIKDRYCRVYALDSDLNLMWQYHSPKNTGHFPLAVDVNGDGHDELLCGYTLLDCKGQPVWTYPIEKDHTDEIVAGKFVAGSDKGYFACVSGTQGFFKEISRAISWRGTGWAMLRESAWQTIVRNGTALRLQCPISGDIKG